MTKRDELLQAIEGLSDEAIVKVIAFAREAQAAARADAGLDSESRAWLDAELAPPLEPFDWAGADPDTVGKPVEWDEASGSFVVVGGKE